MERFCRGYVSVLLIARLLSGCATLGKQFVFKGPLTIEVGKTTKDHPTLHLAGLTLWKPKVWDAFRSRIQLP